MPVWKTTTHIKHLLSDEENLTSEEINAKGKAIAATLKRCTTFDDEEIIANFEGVDELSELNSILEDMYLECNRKHIWVD